MKNLKTGIMAAFLVALAICTLWQHQQIRQLMADIISLGNHVTQLTSRQGEIQQSTAQLESTVERLKEDRVELIQLRAQSSRLRQLEQENAKLHIEGERLANQLTQAAKQEVDPSDHKMRPESVIKALSAPPGVMDFGEVEFADKTPMILDFGEGMGCVATATMLSDGQLELNFIFESEVDGIQIQTEQTATVLPGHQIGATVGGFEIALAPKVKAQ